MSSEKVLIAQQYHTWKIPWTGWFQKINIYIYIFDATGIFVRATPYLKKFGATFPHPTDIHARSGRLPGLGVGYGMVLIKHIHTDLETHPGTHLQRTGFASKLVPVCFRDVPARVEIYLEGHAKLLLNSVVWGWVKTDGSKPCSASVPYLEFMMSIPQNGTCKKLLGIFIHSTP